jgi:pyruvate dehydrogenase E2 component (dihydrolipoamide acetyltransferase)
LAVALPTGLVTPVIKQAQTLSLSAIATQSKSLIQRAKDNQLQPNDYESGTFTLSNLGMTRIEQFTAIINPPQAAILAVGRTASNPLWQENGSWKNQQVCKLTLSCDHRVIDGLTGARFLETIIDFGENPLKMLQ